MANTEFLDSDGANYFDIDGNVILPFIVEIPCDTDIEFIDLLPGDYTLTILDENGCEIEETFTMLPPPLSLINLAAI